MELSGATIRERRKEDHMTQKELAVLISGEDGIRTHAPFRTNGFQDRLVMTTSIPLRVLVSNQCRNNITICFHQCQHFFSLFLFKYNSAAIMSSGVVIFRF